MKALPSTREVQAWMEYGVKFEATDFRIPSAESINLRRTVQATVCPTSIGVMLWEFSVCRIGASASRKK